MQRGTTRIRRTTLLCLSTLACTLIWLAAAGASQAGEASPKSKLSDVSAAATKPSAKKSTAPMRLDRDILAGIGLEELPALPRSMVLEGGRGHRGKILYRTDQIVVEVWEADAAILTIPDPTPYDEYVLILSGKLILVDGHGTRTEYAAGESLIVPEGFKGTWEMQGNFRELVVIERKAYDRAEANE